MFVFIQVVISQMNGQDYPSHSVHIFNVGKSRLKLSRGWINKTRESYSTAMQVHDWWLLLSLPCFMSMICTHVRSFLFCTMTQLCGVRGGGNAASKSLFWQARKGVSYVLTFETERDRNAAIILARKHALDSHVSLTCPLMHYFSPKRNIWKTLIAVYYWIDDS